MNTPMEPDEEPVRPDIRLIPLAAAAWAAAWAATSELVWPVALSGVLALILVGVALHRRSWVLVAGGLVLLVLLATGSIRSAALHGGQVAQLADDRAVVEALITVQADPHRVGQGFTEMVVGRGQALEVVGRGQRWTVSAPVLITASADRGVELLGVTVGTTLRVHGRLAAPEPGSDLAAMLRVSSADVERTPGPSWQLIERVREGLRASVAGRPEEPRALVPALVVGDTSAMTPAITDDFRITGLTHLTAVSGANLTLLLGFLLVLARWVGVRGRGLTVVAVAGVVVFIALCRTEPSVLRAAAMGVVALAALGHGRGGVKGMRHLCVAVLALLVLDPWLGRSVGFTLSVLASAGIIWWARAWAERLRWLPRVMAEGVAVPLAAQVATQPVVTAISGQVSVVGLLSNGLAGPLVGPATVSGFAAAGLSLVHPWPAALAGWVASWAAQVIIWIAHATAAWPGAATTWPASPAGTGLLIMGCALAAWWLPRLLGRWWLVLLLSVLLAVGLMRTPTQPGWPVRGWAMVMCDIGTGDAAVVDLGQGRAVVVDTGGDATLLDRCLDQLGVHEVVVAVLTHYHDDHVGGIDALWEGRRTRQLLVSPIRSPAGVADRIDALAAQHGTPVAATGAGDVITIGTAVWESYWPRRDDTVLGASDAEGESSAENDASVVGRLTVDRFRILFTGDVEPAAQELIMASGVDLTADVLKVPHHGSSRQDRAFCAATRASVAVTSSEEGNAYGHPSPRTIVLLESLGMQVLRTDLQGSIALIPTERGPRAVVQK
ncbi:ComEC/Rec2 family competence protein [Propionibacteriaceae bacterium Y1700]|uniref:ComEC/Rec2 family competence protein n=1 Tax=Microlunatus sp. Y1700 TaxID=3418487 RepID=UPI003DA71C91